ncbi:hypothetical protein GCM10011390_32680 [Aureimonas endophytica]|uniref:Uncharacterized protein n=1 Tax=Aureimonas endophytica TaxID=2027858 RepID=A0A916ZRU8_9HYPH|nr:hypothetical protein [Aureimonas endophytica]GGE11088.1 hypothetical protein GCM10011390_32680 [Aureimonas endophytica]
MAEKVLFIVQQFERRGKKLNPGRSVEYRTEAEAVARAERDAAKFAGVVALTLTVDTDTGEVVEEPRVLARFGEVGKEFQEE